MRTDEQLMIARHTARLIGIEPGKMKQPGSGEAIGHSMKKQKEGS
jgi:hypothetical protein